MGVYQQQQPSYGPAENKLVQRNNVMFGILTILFQIAVGLLYGFLVQPNFPNANTNSNAQNLIPWFLTFCYAMLVIPGFGLLLSYLKNMIWSSLGFTFLITALTLEMYFMANALWSWAAIQQGNYQYNKPAFNQDAKTYYFALTYGSGAVFGDSYTYAFKAALANVVAFSAIIGRAGPLEAFILVFFGTIGFELQRTVLTNYSFDGPSTFTIFIYGGFLGLIASLMLRFRENRTSEAGNIHHTAHNPNYTANNFSATIALIGTLITWVFFPVLALDPTLLNGGIFTGYTGPLSMVFALSSSTITALITSSLINDKINIRDVVYGSIAGGVASATASTFVTNPVYGILIGIAAGFVQVVGQNFIEKRRAKENDVMHTTSFILFGVQGLLGASFAAGWNAIIWTTSNGFSYSYNVAAGPTQFPVQSSGWQFLMGLMCIGFGIGVGILVGIFVMICASHNSQDHFHDYTYWLDDDGISQPIEQQRPIEPVKEPEYQPAPDAPQIEVVEGDHQIKNQHAYL